MRDELLERELFVNLKEAQILLEDYRDHYNHNRPHGALGYLTPAEFASMEALRGQGPGPSEQLECVQGLSL
jgi:putative transposase